mgnify:CR=1 FL=1
MDKPKKPTIERLDAAERAIAALRKEVANPNKEMADLRTKCGTPRTIRRLGRR